MKKKLLVIPVILLTFVLLSIPVMAAPATKIEGVTLTFDHIPTLGPQNFVDHTIIQTRGGTSFGEATLTIPGIPLPKGTWDTTWTSTAKWPSFPIPDPEGGNMIREKVKMIFTGVGTNGTFEGRAQWKWVGTMGALLSIEVHMVLRGTGDFKGQTLKLSSEPALPAVIEGCLIIPK
ncbi:hypothetical protein ACFLRN_09550 [Thermoproteota archaeon]